MPNVAAVLKEEIRRLARKESKTAVGPLKKQLAAERKASASVRKELAAQKRALAQLVGAVKRQAKGGGAAVTVEAAAAPAGKWRKDTVRSTRRALGLTQGQLAKLVGVSPITVSFWETGRSIPRAKQQAAVLAVRELSKSEAHERLGAAGGKRKPGPKPGTKRKAKRAGKRAGKKAGAKKAKRRARKTKARRKKA